MTSIEKPSPEDFKQITSKDSEIYLRRQKAWGLFIQGFSQQEIAEKLNVSYKTISRDFHELKKESAKWMETLPRGEIQLYHKSNFEMVKRVNQELWKLYEETEDEKLKLKILSTIAEKSKLHSQMLDSSNFLKVRNQIHEELSPTNVFASPFDGKRTEIDYDNLMN